LSDKYLGFVDRYLSDEELAAFYSDLTFNRFDLFRNEYLLLTDIDGNTIDTYRWNGETHVRVPTKQIKTRYLGTIRPRNPQQVCAIDMLYNTDMTVKMLQGPFGSGKILPRRAATLG